MSVSLQCVFHSIRFKVNKGWSTAVLLFFALYFPFGLMLFRKRRNEWYWDNLWMRLSKLRWIIKFP